MIKYLRMLPHPKYGNYGGLDHHTGDEPIDDLDAAFMLHDHAFILGQSKRQADRALVVKLKGKLKLKHPIYGRLYKLAALIAMQILSRL